MRKGIFNCKKTNVFKKYYVINITDTTFKVWRSLMLTIYTSAGCKFIFGALHAISLLHSACKHITREHKHSGYCMSTMIAGMLTCLILYIAVLGVSSLGCPTNCIKCNGNSNNCDQCMPGYYLSTGFCYKCQSPCLECISPSSCISCVSQYYKNGYYCYPCSGPCLECNGESHCTSCYSGYYLKDKECSPCSSMCIECNSSSLCTSCKYGYNLNSGNCSSCIRNCLECTSWSVCNSCESGYYLENDICFACSVGCSECSSSSSCSSCVFGYYPVWSGCARCPNNCSSCQNANACTNCTDGYYLKTIDDNHVTCSLCDVTCSSCVLSMCVQQTKSPAPTTNQPTVASHETIHPNTTQFLPTLETSSTKNHGTIAGQTTSSVKTTVTMGTMSQKDSTTIIAGSVGGAGAIVVVVVVSVVLIWIRIRKSKTHGEATDINLDGVVSYSNATHLTERGGLVYSTPNKAKVMSSKSNYGVASEPASPLCYENASVGPGLPPKITAYMDDDIIEETDGLVSDPSGGKVEGVYDTYYNTSELYRRHVTVDTLAEAVAKKTFADYEEEFKKFPDGLSRNYVDALNIVNAGKNRYKNVYPYDATRVVLNDGGDGDYINASYITTSREHIAYIAALGPTVAHTERFSLFWRMVWQEKVEIIIVLTKLKEGEKMKFERYWPLQGKLENYGPVEVQTVTEENFAEFTIRRFSVSKNSEQRTIYQAHYTAWPDRSVPDNLVSLLEFRHKVQTLPSKQSGPIVVHCSAGIGRTGTYIALDLLIHEGQSSDPSDGKGEPSVDVYGCVSALRGQRLNMVQNVDQYRYLHHALVHALIVDTGPIPTSELQTCLSDDGKSRLVHQFKMLQKVMVLQDDYKSVVDSRNNARKNRPGADIPGDKHRPSLSYQGKDSDYINAVYLDGHVDCRKFLVTQTPLQATVKDFLKLVFQKQVHSIVSMDPQHVTDKQDVGLYVPDNNQELKVGTFTVRCTKCKTRPNITLRELNIQNKSGKGTLETTIHQFQFTGWPPDSSVPVSAESLIQIIREVERISDQERESGPIIVHCLTGAERSGLFCTVSLLMEKAINDQAVSVVNTVSHVKSRRSMAIPTVDQYIFCHDCIAVSSQSAEYTNVVGTASHDKPLTSQSAEYTNVAGTASDNISLTSRRAEYTNVAGTSSHNI